MGRQPSIQRYRKVGRSGPEDIDVGESCGIGADGRVTCESQEVIVANQRGHAATSNSAPQYWCWSNSQRHHGGARFQLDNLRDLKVSLWELLRGCGWGGAS